jgi:hypothetical protein
MNTLEKKSIISSILKGEIYAHVESVSNSGMSRRILFFRIVNPKKGKPFLQRITAEIGWLSQTIKPNEWKQGSKWVNEEGLRVNGCGMDMIWNTLNNCLPYGQEWNGQYNTL